MRSVLSVHFLALILAARQWSNDRLLWLVCVGLVTTNANLWSIERGDGNIFCSSRENHIPGWRMRVVAERCRSSLSSITNEWTNEIKKNIRKKPMEINSFVVCLLAYFRGGETNSFACLGDWRVSEKSKKKQKKADELSNGWNEKSLRICVFSHSTGIFAWFFSPIATNMSLSSHSAALLSDHHFRMAPKISRTWCKHLMYGKKKQQTAGRRTGKNNNCRTLNRERGDVRLQCIHCM